MTWLNQLLTDVQRYSQNPIPWIAVGLIIVLAILLLAIHSYLTSPFKYPHYEHDFDVTGMKNPTFTGLIDEYLNENGMEAFAEHHERVLAWKEQNLQRALSSTGKKQRRKQYERSLDDAHEFLFYMVRETHGEGKAGQVVEKAMACPYSALVKRYRALKRSGFSTASQQTGSNMGRIVSEPRKQRAYYA